jgi:hypothetical protein
VRERKARMDSGFAWLRPSSDRLGHLDFWTHTTFALRDGNSGASDEDNTAALDFPAEELAVLRRVVAQRLAGYVTGPLRSASVDDFMAPLEEFVLAQRLARVALQGQLGPDFPLSRLIDLERQTRRFVPRQPTIRWEPAGSPQELAQVLDSADRSAGESYRAYELDQLQRRTEKRPACDAASG